MNDLLHKEISKPILKTFYDVYNELGYGFLEKVYQNAMYLELKAQGYEVEAQKQIKVYYKNQVVGEYYADLVIENTIIVELKACECLVSLHISQLMNYLSSTTIEVGLVLNFGETPEFKRLIYTNNRKPNIKNLR
ncbi:GxxExxY protein [Flavobacterium sp. MC2016-06]|jgi:GxxExxY protein|uniref:GxxExxY protein n=1 Tax=Flavobacterium sp. MC2016-06 TaxID=2676308 RepID=UPI0012BAD787|nr:GxxExxY protein [Flavobacterium sp. MC2016-06]MBU3861377.1 GxxExxY protein [Flavobacterium sp. MC2016-06]